MGDDHTDAVADRPIASVFENYAIGEGRPQRAQGRLSAYAWRRPEPAWRVWAAERQSRTLPPRRSHDGSPPKADIGATSNASALAVTMPNPGAESHPENLWGFSNACRQMRTLKSSAVPPIFRRGALHYSCKIDPVLER